MATSSKSKADTVKKKKSLISLKAAPGGSDEGDHDRRPELCRFRIASSLSLERTACWELIQWQDDLSV